MQFWHVNVCKGISISKLRSTSTSAGIKKSDVYYLDLNISIVKSNVGMIDSHKNWNAFLHKESLRIRDMKPVLDDGLKVSKKLDAF